MAGEGRIARFCVDVRQIGAQAVVAQRRGERKYRCLDPGPVQMPAVEVENASPFGVEVNLGQGADDDRAVLCRPAQEFQLRRGVLLAGVRDEHDRVGIGCGPQGRGGASVGEAAVHPGRVDDYQSGRQKFMRDADLHAATGRLVDHGFRAGGRVLDHCGHHGRPDRVDRADLQVQQRIDQRALSLLELTDHHHLAGRRGQPRAFPGQPCL